MTEERDREMSEAESRMAERIAQTVIARLFDKLEDEETADRVLQKWGAAVDKTIGRGIRRALWYLVLALIGIASVKFGLTEKLLAMLKP